MELLAVILILSLGVIYFTPTIILAMRKATGTGWGSFVILINIFLGWTVIGWFIALVMAFAAKGAK